MVKFFKVDIMTIHIKKLLFLKNYKESILKYVYKILILKKESIELSLKKTFQENKLMLKTA
jgi:hypothetical protein